MNVLLFKKKKLISLFILFVVFEIFSKKLTCHIIGYVVCWKAEYGNGERKEIGNRDVENHLAIQI